MNFPLAQSIIPTQTQAGMTTLPDLEHQEKETLKVPLHDTIALELSLCYRIGLK